MTHFKNTASHRIERVVRLMVLSIALVGCDTIYKSSDVREFSENGTDVRVMPITPQNILFANRSSYTPKDLPAVFSSAASGSGLRGSGALPQPTFKNLERPGALEVRLPPAPASEPYKIGVGDVLLLATPAATTVAELTGLLAAQNSRQGYTVQDDGTIAIPNVGRVQVSGLTVEEAEATLFERLVEAQIDPSLSLEISEFNSKRVSIGGAVNDPGVVPITITPLYLDEIISQAGGVNAADIDDVNVRLYRDGSLYLIPISKVYNGARTRIIANDSIFVDTTYQLDQAAAFFAQQIELNRERRNARSAALSQLNTEISIQRAQLDERRANYRAAVDLDAVERDYVYVTGEVQSPGRFTLPLGRKATLSDALFEGASGLKELSADPREIYVLRGDADPLEFGSLTAWQLNASNAANFVLATRFELRPNDIVFVSQQPVTKWSRAINQITPTIINLGASSLD